jgi:hypothetical protein
VSLIKSGAVLRVIVNGREVLKYEDKEPLAVSRVGLGGYKTRANFSNVEIVNLPGGR